MAEVGSDTASLDSHLSAFGVGGTGGSPQIIVIIVVVVVVVVVVAAVVVAVFQATRLLLRRLSRKTYYDFTKKYRVMAGQRA